MPLGLTAFGTGRPREIARKDGRRRGSRTQKATAKILQTRRVSVTSTHPTLTDVAHKEGSMAKQERITARRSPQDLPLIISRVALYARVSTSNGHQDPEMQLAELREYADRRCWEIVGEYTDQGVSGSKESRPELNRLMSDAYLRRFDAVLVWKIDRFGRSLKHLVNALADLGAYGVAFISLRDNLDLSTPSGRLMFQIIGGHGGI